MHPHGIRRGAGIEAVIGHMKGDGHRGRSFLAGATGDAIDAVLVVAGHNLRPLRAWLTLLLALFLSLLTIGAPTAPRRSQHLIAR